ncbi:hypothetical protein BCA33_16740 [Marinobacter sp. AC-23]|nr:hypothetical protein BCA33_16740 [Marinobacter sp. AC-23]
MKTTATGKSENILNDCPARLLHFIDAELFFFVDRYLNRFAVTREPLLNIQSAHDRSRAFIRNLLMVNDK